MLGRLLEDRGWQQLADKLFDAVSRLPDRVSRAINRKAGSRWYPGWRLRRIWSAGRVPWGIDANAIRAHGYALVRRKQPYCADYWVQRYLRPRLERDHEAGETEATFLLGVLESAAEAMESRSQPSPWIPNPDKANPEHWLRLAAEAGHGQAAIELGPFWYKRAADARHPEASYQLALSLCSTDRVAAETECRNAARSGHLLAAALLRILQRSTSTAEPTGYGPEDGRIGELLATWEALHRLAPEPDQCIDFLVERSGLPRADIARLRAVRDRCAAYPAEPGWPTSYELDLALAIAHQLQSRIEPATS